MATHSVVQFVLALLFVVSTSGQNIGYWWWTWGSGNFPGGTNMGIAFSGYVDPGQAISSSKGIQNQLPGTKYIALGGGNGAGSWTASALNNINAAINGGEFSGYNGIAYDIEEGDSGLGGSFQQSFQLAKNQGFKVLVTISHSAPYGIGDAYSLMQTFLGDGNIDYLSPQLYTSGTESQNDYATSQGVGWNMYSGSQASVVPSIVQWNLFPSAQTYFSQQGVNITGFIQWAN